MVVPQEHTHTHTHTYTELLVVIRETENGDLTNVMQELIETYAEQIGDMAVSLCASLVSCRVSH